ncbi:hypothetical protein ACFFNY_06885 [Paenibacillus hodogayensis]|uniref:Uncharacterized protein n=1 Tax=Paenibacillus hodogayensis TaxID=279208 RepID=A0ABV5VSN7_9BACL
MDVFLGKQTRIHKDLDIAVFWEDRYSIVDFMLSVGGWRVFEACGGGIIHELLDKQQSFEKRNLFCFTSNENRCTLESIGNDRYRFGLQTKEQKDFTYEIRELNKDVNRSRRTIRKPGCPMPSTLTLNRERPANRRLRRAR